MPRNNMPTGVACVNRKPTKTSYVAISKRRGINLSGNLVVKDNLVTDLSNADLAFTASVASKDANGKRAVIKLVAKTPVGAVLAAPPPIDGVLSITLLNLDIAEGQPGYEIEVADIIVDYIDEAGAP